MPVPNRPLEPSTAFSGAARAVTSSHSTLATIFASLGDPTRLKLVSMLCAGGAFSIAQLTATTEISRQGVTKHLQVLSEAGVVRDVKHGRERLWQLDPAQIEEARRSLEQIGAMWDERLARLKAFAELPDETSQTNAVPKKNDGARRAAASKLPSRRPRATVRKK